MIDGPKFSDIEKKNFIRCFKSQFFFGKVDKRKINKKCDLKIILSMVIYNHYYKHMMKKDDEKERDSVTFTHQQPI